MQNRAESEREERVCRSRGRFCRTERERVNISTRESATLQLVRRACRRYTDSILRELGPHIQDIENSVVMAKSTHRFLFRENYNITFFPHRKRLYCRLNI